MANKPASAANPKGGADPATAGRIKQIRMVAGIIRKSNPRALPLIALAGLGVLAVFVVVGLLTGLLALLIPLGVLTGLMAAMILFGRYAQSAQYAAVEGQPGAAAAILQTMRGGWTVTPAVSANRSMDVVHRAVGKPGVVLVGEGSPSRLPSLLAAEKKRISRVAFDVPDLRPAGRQRGRADPDPQAAAQAHAAAPQPQGPGGRGPELPAEGAAPVAAGAQGTGAQDRPHAQASASPVPLATQPTGPAGAALAPAHPSR